MNKNDLFKINNSVTENLSKKQFSDAEKVTDKIISELKNLANSGCLRFPYVCMYYIEFTSLDKKLSKIRYKFIKSKMENLGFLP